MLHKILIIDDEEPARNTIKLQLAGTEYDILEAADGEEGITLISTGDHALTVDLIICDIRMPKIDGIEAVSYFRREYPSTPVIILTGYPDVDLAVDFMKQGASDYLVKPVEKEELIAAVGRAISGRSLFR